MRPRCLYLSSTGCLNPTDPLEPADLMDFWDSRSRVIALIDDLRSFAPGGFRRAIPTSIEGAWRVIEGEPKNVLGPAATV